jgi:hypothetical protein
MVQLPYNNERKREKAVEGRWWFVKNQGDVGQSEEAPRKVDNVISNNIRDGVFGSAHSRDVLGVVSPKS